MRRTHPSRHRSRTRAILALCAIAALFTVAPVASARPAYYIVNTNSGKVLMPAGGSTAWGTPIFQRAKDNAAAQHWFRNYENGGLASYTNRKSNLCIHPSDWDPVAGAGAYLLQASCTTTNGARLWAVVPDTSSS